MDRCPSRSGGTAGRTLGLLATARRSSGRKGTGRRRPPVRETSCKRRDPGGRMADYTATAICEGDYWVIDVPGIGTTQGRQRRRDRADGRRSRHRDDPRRHTRCTSRCASFDPASTGETPPPGREPREGPVPSTGVPHRSPRSGHDQAQCPEPGRARHLGLRDGASEVSGRHVRSTVLTCAFRPAAARRRGGGCRRRPSTARWGRSSSARCRPRRARQPASSP